MICHAKKQVRALVAHVGLTTDSWVPHQLRRTVHPGAADSPQAQRDLGGVKK